MKTILLKPTHIIEEVEVEEPNNLDELYHYLDCDTIEIVYLFSPGLSTFHRLVMVIDERGKLTGKLFNRTATKLARGYIMQNDFIVGNALIFIAQGEELIHLDQAQLESLMIELKSYSG